MPHNPSITANSAGFPSLRSLKIPESSSNSHRGGKCHNFQNEPETGLRI
nr:MAG TPA: hypothetical protein [Caudoviricetes sp.]